MTCTQPRYIFSGPPAAGRCSEDHFRRSQRRPRVNFDGHQTVTVTMDHLPGTVPTPVDGRRSQPHFLRLTVDVPSEPLKLDGETERIVETSGEVLRAPGLVVQRLGCCGQELAQLV